jgi:polyhydroxyalkanoate synthesis regulator phasin
MSNFNTPLNGYSMQEGFEKVKKEQQKKIDELEQQLQQLANKLKKE